VWHVPEPGISRMAHLLRSVLKAGASHKTPARGAEGFREALRGLCDPRYAASRI
jgi:hypothetical protein